MPETKSQPPTPDAPASTLVIELDFDLLSNALTMRAKAPTILLSGVLRRAEAVPTIPLAKEHAPEGPSTRRVRIEYDAATESVKVSSDAMPIIHTGILVMAHSMMTQSQILQRIQGMAARGRA
ncbi:MAG: hypothetical protein V4510_10150 [bacterium]